MFTGIIEKTAPVVSLERKGSSLKLSVATGYSDLSLGESVAVNGVCLTVESSDSAGSAVFDVSEETLRKTQLGSTRPADCVNLERALTLQSRLSGHLVQGHVDGIGVFMGATPEGAGFKADFEVPASLSKYCVSKGSIAIDGVSLTIGELQDLEGSRCRIRVFLVPHTWNLTRISKLRAGDPVNLEADILAKTVERLLSPRVIAKG